jgi:hypothetical protein
MMGNLGIRYLYKFSMRTLGEEARRGVVIRSGSLAHIAGAEERY